mmetsp:Transcript_19683/g.26010  ORF Transcript_19683/g.26010 Transcript_19683/m.26010 type:complete len:82 (+) Transcript_19683:37-282(+)
MTHILLECTKEGTITNLLFVWLNGIKNIQDCKFHCTGTRTILLEDTDNPLKLMTDDFMDLLSSSFFSTLLREKDLNDEKDG